jgi:Rrf2 family transcriptional regulator, iron-sulfur cluster assembly transcription factor
MELTTKGRYAVMALADLARHAQPGRPVTLADIAGRQDISQSYLEQLFARLRRAGLVKAARGPGGGYALAHEPAAISVAAVILAVDEPIKVTACQEHLATGCRGRSTRCITHDLWAELTQHIHGFLAAVSLADVIEDRVRGRAATLAPSALSIAAE